MVWTASYLPFGGVDTTATTPMELRFPGQWFQSESGLHQNWMRDYDPTTGRYTEADPLGLVDGASVYRYARQDPGRYIDPTGEFVPILAGAAIGAGSNLALQLASNYLKYGDLKWQCVDIKAVVYSGAFGAIGFAPGKVFRKQGAKAAAAFFGATTYVKISSGPPIRVGDECECDGGDKDLLDGWKRNFVDFVGNVHPQLCEERDGNSPVCYVDGCGCTPLLLRGKKSTAAHPAVWPTSCVSASLSC